MDHPSAGRGHVLLAPGGRAEEVADLVVGPAEAGGAGVGLEPPHRPVAPFHPSVILLEMVVQMLGRAMFEVIAEDLVEGRRVAVTAREHKSPGPRTSAFSGPDWLRISGCSGPHYLRMGPDYLRTARQHR